MHADRSKPCPFDPTALYAEAFSELTCPVCGEMIVAGIAHPAYWLVDEWLAEDARKAADVTLSPLIPHLPHLVSP